MINISNQIQLIESTQNALIKQIKTFQSTGVKASKLRLETGLALIEGIHLVQSWFDSKLKNHIETIIFSEQSLENIEIQILVEKIVELNEESQSHKIKLVQINDSLINDLSQLIDAPLLLSLVRVKQHDVPERYSQNLVILDGIQDAGNVGTILRTAAAAGYKEVICLKGTAQAWSPKVLRAGMGAHTALTITEGIEFEHILNKLNVNLFSASLTDSQNLYELSDELKMPHAWIFGNEGSGVSQVVQDNSKGVFIPQEKGVESLNVSAAAAICMFEARRIQLFI